MDPADAEAFAHLREATTVRELGWPGGPATAVFHRYYATASGRTTCTTAERGQGRPPSG